MILAVFQNWLTNHQASAILVFQKISSKLDSPASYSKTFLVAENEHLQYTWFSIFEYKLAELLVNSHRKKRLIWEFEN